jgi:hypothetical protein
MTTNTSNAVMTKTFLGSDMHDPTSYPTTRYVEYAREHGSYV